MSLRILASIVVTAFVASSTITALGDELPWIEEVQSLVTARLTRGVEDELRAVVGEDRLEPRTIGDVDERLPAQAKVLGLIGQDGDPVAFPVEEALAFLNAGGTIDHQGVSVVPDASGLTAVAADGSDPGVHESFWFAWSQFHPETMLWQPEG